MGPWDGRHAQRDDVTWQALGVRSAGDPPSRTHGVAYRVPEDKVEDVLSDLDFREKGGYTRAVVDVYPIAGEPGWGGFGAFREGDAPCYTHISYTQSLPATSGGR